MHRALNILTSRYRLPLLHATIVSKPGPLIKNRMTMEYTSKVGNIVDTKTFEAYNATEDRPVHVHWCGFESLT